jgi:hypothetical protein
MSIFRSLQVRVFISGFFCLLFLIYGLWFNFQSVFSLPVLYFLIGGWLTACTLTTFLARKLDRSMLDWFALAGLFPFLSPLILPFLGKGNASANPYGGCIGHMLAISTGKFCGRCRKAVPISSRAGQNCPFCGVHWDSERTIYRNH